MNPSREFFIVFEGPPKAGKTNLQFNLATKLNQLGYNTKCILTSAYFKPNGWNGMTNFSVAVINAAILSDIYDRQIVPAMKKGIICILDNWVMYCIYHSGITMLNEYAPLINACTHVIGNTDTCVSYLMPKSNIDTNDKSLKSLIHEYQYGFAIRKQKGYTELVCRYPCYRTCNNILQNNDTRTTQDMTSQVIYELAREGLLPNVSYSHGDKSCGLAFRCSRASIYGSGASGTVYTKDSIPKF